MDKFDLSSLISATEKLKEELNETQKKASKKTVTGESGAGMVKIVVNGTHHVQSTHLEKSILQQDKNVIEDLITAAINDAINKINQENKNSIPDLSSLLNLGK
ncbi:MAG: YbaB/EbfC family nucleoid-associated protein [Legionellales bacterium]|nr:YbaB/EbfC family nucleoid-associated protein [Legionellales bacterium]